MLDYYWEVNKELKYSPRQGIEDTLALLENGSDVVFTAPTGYGKTTLTKVLGVASSKGNQLFDRVIHVLPFRGIVQDLYSKLRDEKNKLGIKSVGAQDMDYHDAPYYLKKVNVTTLDSFILNLFKVPVDEFKRVIKGNGSHFEVPRGMIYSSVVIFDEFHLFAEEGRALSSTLSAIRALKNAMVPVVIMTATLTTQMKDELLAMGFKHVHATDFHVDRRLRTEFVSDPVEAVEKGKKNLMVFNTREGAIKAYVELKRRGHRPLLIHSKFNTQDRKKKVEELQKMSADKSEYDVAVTTQVVEAGIDVSFDVLITEACPADSLLQRAGRVARYGGDGVVKIFPFSGKVYDKEEVERTMREAERRGIDPAILSVLKRGVERDMALEKSLEIIDSNVMFSARTASDLMMEMCSLTREVSLIPGFPPRTRDAQQAIPLTEYEARRLLPGKVVPYEGDEEDFQPHSQCLPVELLKNGIEGVVIKGYDPEVGGII
ncbi:CRISPR-associated helicase Cas3' [Metallosphaera tengchongensis]|uniref:CRISPR-associated helicase Cas3 n=1 Tax=Metallosphaera tengchongensis TaxID=1532350 RepID=A0A6N0NXX8_9CREN|nr:CRISPR-associated helicase Cas3' [Metallosphaera tengchongensis]